MKGILLFCNKDGCNSELKFNQLSENEFEMFCPLCGTAIKGVKNCF